MRDAVLRVVRACVIAVSCAAAWSSASTAASTPIRYRFTFPEPQHHWMQVEMALTGLPAAPIELRMSRSSPGRYSLHDFAKNVYDVSAHDSDGGPLALVRTGAHSWNIPEHGGVVTVRYKVYGDRLDGTYLAIDPTHAHINMPAAVMFARGLDDRPSTLSFVPPANARWEVATQLYATDRPFEFTAPNLQYLMDSPAELGPITMRQFKVGGSTFRFAAHQTGTADELNAFVGDVEKIVRAEGDIFGEFPQYETGAYTFLADYLPYASGDAMEHRNSTVMTAPGTIRSNRLGLLDTVAHEFFHGWNVERIRPRSLEPFDFERANLSGELWLAEGFTQYYGPLVLSRSKLVDPQATAATLAGLINAIVVNPGRETRSAEEMSQMAVFIDGGRTVDRTNWSNTVISYYPYGGALALALDLSLRERSGGRTTLDEYMRAMWRVHGKPGGAREGYVDHPYTMEDAEARLTEVAGNPVFARDFFARFIRGRELPDYQALLSRAGLVVRPVARARAWWGDVNLELRDGVRITATPLANTPAYKAGLDVDDIIWSLDGVRLSSTEDIPAIFRRHRVGDVVVAEYADRSGQMKTAPIVLAEDPRVDVMTIESTGVAPSAAQRAFRQSWLGW